MYRSHEFAALAGVTVRTLHHYDKVGLLKPRRTAAGYRLYSEDDLERLEQIAVWKFFGFPLAKIRQLLDRNGLSLGCALALQRRVLEEKRRQLDAAARSIAEAERVVASGGKPDWQLFQKIIREVNMQNDQDWMARYYDDAARAKVEERKALWSPELQARVSKEWEDLFRDVEAALGEDPAGESAGDGGTVEEAGGRVHRGRSGNLGGIEGDVCRSAELACGGATAGSV